MIDLTELENRLDKALENETEESLTNWLSSQRSQPIIITNPSLKLLRFIRCLEIKNIRSRAELKQNRDKYFGGKEAD